MKKSNKILSLLLAFAMVFSTIVPAFAETKGEGQGPVPANSVTFNVKVKRHNDPVNFEKDKSNKFVLYKATEEGTNWEKVNGGVTSTKYVEGKDKNYNVITLAELTKKTSYKVVVNDLSSKTVETTDGVKVNGFEFYVDEYGTVKTADKKETIDFAKKVYEMVLALKDGEREKFRIVSLNEEGKRKANVKFSFVNLANSNGKYDVTENGVYKVKENGTIKDTKITGRPLVTDENGEFQLTEMELKVLVNETDLVGNQRIVGIVVNGELVAVVEVTGIVNKDAKDIPDVVLRKPMASGLLKVHVKGYANKTDLNNQQAPKALKDAEVKILQNETKYQGEVKFGKVLAETKTDADGYAEIKNPQNVGNIIEILESSNDKRDGYYTNITLKNKVTVSLAGYMTKEFMFDKAPLTVNNDGNYELNVTLYPEGYEFTNRISGPKRYDTSVEVARKAFPKLNEVKNIVIASGDNFADGLTAASLSKYMDAPIVLNGRGGAEKSVKQFVKDVNNARKTNAEAKDQTKVNIVLVGGNSYLSGALTNELEALGNPVQRIYGANRYETSAKVFAHIEKFYPGYVKANKRFYEPFIASGENFADALVASVPAALEGRPILLVSKTGVDSSVKDVLAKKEITKAIVVGGTSSVSDAALAQISVPTERLSGKNRQLTSMKLAGRFFMNAGQAIVVDGTDFADALAAAQYGAKVNAPVLLTASKTVLGKELAQYLRDNKMTQITIVGGTGSVSQGIEKEIAKVLGGGEIK